MSLLLVVVLLFFSSSCSVSSGQYYVSDDCSSVTQSPCNPLSVYAGNMSQYNNTIFYFIGTTSISNYVIAMTAVKNVTLHGLDQSPSIHCNEEVSKNSIAVQYSDNVTISNISFSDCTVKVDSSNNITITNSVFASSFGTNHYYYSLVTSNAFDLKISSSVFSAGFLWYPFYTPLPGCSDELLHYSLILTNVTFTAGSGIELDMLHGTTYNVSIIFDHVQCCTKHGLQPGGLFYFLIINSSFYDDDDGAGLLIAFDENSKSTDCSYPGTQLTSTLLIEDSQIYNNKQGLKIISDVYLIEAVNYHIIIKSCLIYDNINEGLFIDGTFLRFLQIDIIDTELIGNGGNKIMNSNAISLSNVTVANSTSTGLSLTASLVTIKNDLIVKNNTGVVGGGLAMNDSSALIVSSSANLKFIDNHASYKGGGIYVEESTHSDILNTPNIPLTLINNSAGLVGGDVYGVYGKTHSSQFNLMNPNISSTSDAANICFFHLHTTTSYKNCKKTVSDQHIYPGQALKFNVALFGYDYFGSLTPTDGTVEITNDYGTLLNETYIPNTCSLIEYTPKLTQTEYKSELDITSSKTNNVIFHLIVNECPIGFTLDKSQGSCTCSQSLSRENVTCDINTLNITHNGLLWIGTYHTTTPFNANETNPNACIINEDCLLYCSPNSVTFKLNHTHTQCVDNRGHRMCGSCTEGYSLLMGSNKCGQCHNNYMMIAWIALFAVMGVLLVVLLIALNLTVSVGTLNGLLFYANIVKLYEPVFSRKGALPVLSQVISWINLDFGFEICFYNVH
uniref:Right handed beta helix domain-containing protein n=2 Tax=Amphimedon queenslandica TaxID=400682 RepID=A0A1X7TQU2_AMPQE